ncbi:MAG: PqiC family protein [bacterium]|nr:PqiC family protein [bacterium]
MMRRLWFQLAVMILSVYLISLGGCTTTPPTNFYILTPLPSAESLGPATVAAGGPSIGIGPVTLPQYLDRPQIVTRASRARLKLGEFDQWAAPLKDIVASVLAENLSMLMSTDRIAVYPWPRSTTIDYQITVDVTRFDGEMGGEVLLLARWSIVGKDGKEWVKKNSRFSQPAGAPNYESTVTVMSRALERLSRDIAAGFRIIRP